MPERLALAILDLVGGAGNVAEASHCMVRLRLVLRDPDRADRAAIAALDGVAIVVDRAGQLQIGLVRQLAETHAALRALLA